MLKLIQFIFNFLLLLNISPAAKAQYFPDIIGDGRNFTSQYNFDIRSTNISQFNGVVRIQIDTDGNLNGLTTSKAENNHIGFGDIRFISDAIQYGIKFNRNDGDLENGLYIAPSFLNRAEFNYGKKDLYGIPTNIDPKTAKFLSEITVTEVPFGDFSRIIIEFPQKYIEDGNYYFQVLFECANDISNGDFHVITPPNDAGNGEKIDYPQIEMGGGDSILDEDGGGDFKFEFLLPLLLIVLILLLLSSGDGKSNTPVPLLPISEIKSTPENGSFLFTFLLLCNTIFYRKIKVSRLCSKSK